jgi:hypothetical protein
VPRLSTGFRTMSYQLEGWFLAPVFYGSHDLFFGEWYSDPINKFRTRQFFIRRSPEAASDD